jgi:hypothetical protein
VTLVEETITALGIDPVASTLPSDPDGPRRFALRRGSAQLVVAVHPPAPGMEQGTLRVVAPVIRIPREDRQLTLFRRLLEANAQELVGVAFALAGDDVVVVAERSLQDLDSSEVQAMIRTVGSSADRFDDELAQAYHTSRSSDPKPSS